MMGYDPSDAVAIGIMRGDLARALLAAGRALEAGVQVSQSLSALANRHPRCHAFSLCTYGAILASSDQADLARLAYEAAEAVAERAHDAEGLDLARAGLRALGRPRLGA